MIQAVGFFPRKRKNLLRAFVWVVLAVFILTSVGVALVNFSAQ